MLSGAISPAFAPASIDILHKVILSSIVISNIVEPENSITCPVPAAVPISLITFKIISLDVTFFLSFPLMIILMFFGLVCTNVCVAKTCSTSDVPIPKAKDPNAPCVDV